MSQSLVDCDGSLRPARAVRCAGAGRYVDVEGYMQGRSEKCLVEPTMVFTLYLLHHGLLLAMRERHGEMRETSLPLPPCPTP